MANYQAITRSNYFSVRDVERFYEVMKSCKAEEPIKVFGIEERDRGILFGFGCYGAINGFPAADDEDDCETNLDAFYDALQSVVSENDAIIITEIGSEKLRYLVGNSTIITHNDIQVVDLKTEAINIAKNMLDNKGFQTRMDY